MTIQSQTSCAKRTFPPCAAARFAFDRRAGVSPSRWSCWPRSEFCWKGKVVVLFASDFSFFCDEKTEACRATFYLKSKIFDEGN